MEKFMPADTVGFSKTVSDRYSHDTGFFNLFTLTLNKKPAPKRETGLLVRLNTAFTLEKSELRGAIKKSAAFIAETDKKISLIQRSVKDIETREKQRGRSMSAEDAPITVRAAKRLTEERAAKLDKAVHSDISAGVRTGMSRALRRMRNEREFESRR